ncbi:hypothetical protein PC41400_07100 [Paenibacillus chitinolyticus]|uniref:Uncharacterized protein n=1 Tax=Paenibacillus chitinolyticus TaxID=79263 RepID=A0A410WSX9_9BACL|nr:hypothetical protein [Paenibacillus chitinolyticus]MCY9588812.1 hypothetical protein [Paenibacillus chitinolyticus]MCY9595684.1 hypothetical protein [Paenibacillus chitinolyticus]QAV17441.1 hypothetical protein PC41400_07100 [Paenibacillus chitinolyticus]
MNDNLNNNAGGLNDTEENANFNAAAGESASEAVAAEAAGAPEAGSPEAVLAARAADADKAAQARAARRTRTPKPLRVLNTSLGVVLAANLLLVPAVYAESKAAEPQIIEWSNEDVKTYFDPSADWNIPLPEQLDKPGAGATPTPTPSAGVGTGGTGAGVGTAAPIVYNNGLNWTDLMLYHLIFNSGGSYSSSGWSSSRPSYDYRTKKPYSVPTYDSTKFQNKQTANSTVKPKTSNTTGAFNSKSTINSRNNSSKSSSTTGSSSTGKSSTSSGSSSTKSGTSSSSGSVSSGSSSKSSSSSSGSIGGKSGGFSSSGSSSSGS